MDIEMFRDGMGWGIAIGWLRHGLHRIAAVGDVVGAFGVLLLEILAAWTSVGDRGKKQDESG